MRVLITRPATDALVAAGYEVAAFPLLIIERVDGVKINLSGAQAFIVSDAEGARALADAVGVRTFPVFAETSTVAAPAPWDSAMSPPVMPQTSRDLSSRGARLSSGC